MANASSYSGARPADPDDGWGPATSFRAATAASVDAPGAGSGYGSAGNRAAGNGAAGYGSAGYGYGSAPDHGHGVGRGTQLDPAQDAYWGQPDDHYEATASPRYAQQAAGSARERLSAILPAHGERQRGLPAWGALLVLLAIAGVGGAIDMLSGTTVRGWFNVGIIAASIVAILVVRRSAMFPIVIAPPIVYSLASGTSLYIRSGGLDDRKVLIDSAANWLVYGFPAIAAATAAVLIIAGVRMILRK